SDPNSDPLTAVLDTNASNGTVVLNADGSVTYTPTGGFSGTDSFTYHAHDGALNSNVVTVTVMINGAPVANADSAMTVEGVAVSIAVLTNDTDDGGLNAASVVVENGPTNGTTSVNSGTGGITYTPNAAYLGTDSFTYTVQDLQGVTSNAATVTVEVTDGNVAPTAVADGYSGTQALQLSIVGPGVLTNDSDLNSDPLTAVLDTNTSHGTVGLNADGSFTYTPTAGFSGTDSFTYHAHDGALDSNVVTVILNINGAPVANNDSTTTVKGVATTIAVLTNDTDDGGLNVASVIVQSGPTNGTTSVNSGSGVITYTPNATYLGTDSFTYTVQDLAGILSNVATVTVTVNEAPQGPLITSVSVLSGKPYTLGTFATGELLYIDRNYTVQANHSAILDGQEYIRTANNDKNGTSANYLTMELSAPAIVYVLYDHRATVLPAWLDDNTWTLDSGVVETTDVDRVLYFKNFPAGTVELGGNANSPMSGAKSMYSVVVIGQGW
ncbi:MAG: Ig-like domain-containing protein, partial [Nitrospirae bacterium]|nr:Ig-like domain-containing protein [Nitrospirota bacterium]